MSPREIAAKLEVNPNTVKSYLHRAIGEGLIRRSDVYFCVPAKQRRADSTIREWFNDPGQVLGDLYEDIREIEIGLHRTVRTQLVKQYGDGETGWWRQGVPLKVRQKCHSRREEDPEEPCETFAYSDLVDLVDTLERQWPLFTHLFPAFKGNKKRLRQELSRLNRIRNKVMHPVRGFVPTEDDFGFVRALRASLRCDAEQEPMDLES